MFGRHKSSAEKRRRTRCCAIGGSCAAPFAIQPETLEVRALLSVSPVQIANVGDKTAAATSLNSGTFSEAVPVGDSIIVTFAMDPSSGIVSVSDSQGNTYSRDVDVTNGSGTSGVRTLVFSAPVTHPLATSDSLTLSFPSTTAKALAVEMVNGLVKIATDETDTGTSNSPSTAVDSGSTAMTSQANELLIGAIGSENKSSTTIPGSGYTLLSQASTGSRGSLSNNVALDTEWEQVSSTGSYSATGTLSTRVNWAAAIVTYTIGPFLTPAADQSAADGDEALSLGSFTDNGTAGGPWTVDVDWGDGSTHTTFSQSSAGMLPLTGRFAGHSARYNRFGRLNLTRSLASQILRGGRRETDVEFFARVALSD